MIPVNQIICGDALSILRTLPEASIDICCTSPPYFSLRSYLPADHPWKPLELGTEPSYDAYITRLCDVFDEVKRVLKPTGTCWVNLNDVYAGDGSKNSTPKMQTRRDTYRGGVDVRRPRTLLPRKSLCLIPFRFAIEMLNRGWICRNVLIWRRANVTPESVTDRFTNDFEYMFVFSTSPRYYFQQQFEPTVDGRGKRNMRAVWDIPTKPFINLSSVKHYASYPEKLVETPILAGCPPGGIVADPFVGTGTTAVVAKRLGRRYIGIDLNPEYCDLARQRVGTRYTHRA